MSRSRRHRPFRPICGGGSLNESKRIGNRIMRRTGRVELRMKGEDAVFLVYDEAMDLWSTPHDGKKSYQPFDWRPKILWYRWKWKGEFPIVEQPDYWRWYRWALRK